jgi:hypothetical protein
VRRLRTTMLAVAAVICLAALLTPVVSAKGPPAPSVTLFTLTGAGANEGGDYCLFAVTIDYRGHLSKDATVTVHDNVTPSEVTGGAFSHHIDHTFQFGAGFLALDFASTNTSIDFIVEFDGAFMAETTPTFAGTGSCPTGTYSYSS